MLRGRWECEVIPEGAVYASYNNNNNNNNVQDLVVFRMLLVFPGIFAARIRWKLNIIDINACRSQDRYLFFTYIIIYTYIKYNYRYINGLWIVKSWIRSSIIGNVIYSLMSHAYIVLLCNSQWTDIKNLNRPKVRCLVTLLKSKVK